MIVVEDICVLVVDDTNYSRSGPQCCDLGSCCGCKVVVVV